MFSVLGLKNKNEHVAAVDPGSAGKGIECHSKIDADLLHQGRGISNLYFKETCGSKWEISWCQGDAENRKVKVVLWPSYTNAHALTHTCALEHTLTHPTHRKCSTFVALVRLETVAKGGCSITL